MRSTNSLYGKDILDISALTRADIELIFQTAQIMKKRLKQKINKSSYLKGKAIINLFCEPSTRTRTSFKLAGKYLGADVINFSTSASSLLKGESFRDTLLTLQAMHCDGVILRHPVEGAAVFAACELNPVVINAGDGAHAHPTQALLDLFTLREKGITLDGLKMAIVGDILHSRVARSNIALWKKYGADIHVCGPATLIPHDIEQLGVSVHDRIEDALEGAAVINALRIQLERQQKGMFPSAHEYAQFFGINEKRLKLACPNAVIIHPGPLNRGLEIAWQTAYSDQAAILQQVENGVAVRMALLALTLNGDLNENFD